MKDCNARERERVAESMIFFLVFFFSSHSRHLPVRVFRLLAPPDTQTVFFVVHFFGFLRGCRFPSPLQHAWSHVKLRDDNDAIIECCHWLFFVQ